MMPSALSRISCPWVLRVLRLVSFKPLRADRRLSVARPSKPSRMPWMLLHAVSNLLSTVWLLSYWALVALMELWIWKARVAPAGLAA